MGMPLDSQQRKELSSDKHDPACVANNRDLTNTFLTRKYHDWEDSPRQPDCGEVHMEDEDEDVFQDSAHTWHTPFREIKEVKSENRATQTPSPALLLGSGMLPCGLAEEPRRLFRGNAALRLSHFERVGEAMAEDQWGPADPPRQPAARSVEAEIGQKLQMIGDQFHQEHLQLFQINQRHQRQPFLWRLAWALYTLFIERPEGGRPR
ncbi:BCL2 modifying factor 1 isoform X2 [Clupea harengus]|uniref:BCL2 modifying factor 1 isoform X2 n=1 Tax=Clupea harengus TaxID=7950 RepID=A0A6P3W8C0_CLUHA|nr:BCL2 modifying factor 1 isoform X2 [Clupea harengus]